MSNSIYSNVYREYTDNHSTVNNGGVSKIYFRKPKNLDNK